MAKGRRRYRRVSADDERDLFEYAKGHFESSLLLVAQGPAYFDSAAHLGHLAVELLLKTHLLYGVGSYPATHNLLELADEMSAACSSRVFTAAGRETLERLAKLETARYPQPALTLEFGVWERIVDLCQALERAFPDELYDKIVARPDWAGSDWITKAGRVLMLAPADSQSR